MRHIGELVDQVLEAAGVREDSAASNRVIWVDFRQPNLRVPCARADQDHRRYEKRRFE